MSVVKFMIVMLLIVLLSATGVQGKDYNVEVYNIDGNKMPSGGGTIYIDFFEFLTNKIFTSSADFNGGEPSVKVKLSNGPDNIESISVYNLPKSSFREKEYWGTQGNITDTKNAQFMRKWPYISSFAINGKSAGQKQTVTVNQPIEFKITLKDNSAQDHASNLYARPVIFIKKDQFLSHQKEFDPIKGDIHDLDNENSLGTWDLVFAPAEEGTYYYNVRVEAGITVPTFTYYENGKIKYNDDTWQPTLTDQWDWIELDVIADATKDSSVPLIL